ncbi:MAG: prepilin peptidase [Candidatus Moraniibacteriota bacterium]
MPLFLFFLGLIIGSFLNVVIFRLETDEDFVGGRSKCRSCGKTIRWYDNVPLLSFAVLRGKCRDCGAAISWQYPIVELSTAILFFCVGNSLFIPGDTGSIFGATLALGLIPSLIIIFVYDLRHMEIPVSTLVFGTTWVLFSLVLQWLFSSPFEPFLTSRLFSGIVGGGIAFLFFYALVFFSKETWMGSGDAWLAAMLGLVSGWEMLLHSLTLAFGTGAVVGVALLALRRKELSSRIPFGPFLVTSVLIFIFFGKMIGEEFGLFLWM